MEYHDKDVEILFSILKNRRDVRGNRFLGQKINKEIVEKILQAGILAPSVGYSQPWKFVIIDDDEIKNEIYDNFEKENHKAKSIFHDSEQYNTLKLEGIKEAPINIAVLYEDTAHPILGTTSMNKMGEYSVVCAIQNMWLMARALNIGLGWVSILDEQSVLKTINAPQNTTLIAYICLGYVDEFYTEPELKTLKWEQEKKLEEILFYNKIV